MVRTSHLQEGSPRHASSSLRGEGLWIGRAVHTEKRWRVRSKMQKKITEAASSPFGELFGICPEGWQWTEPS
jgi:hypothetical protein